MGNPPVTQCPEMIRDGTHTPALVLRVRSVHFEKQVGPTLQGFGRALQHFELESFHVDFDQVWRLQPLFSVERPQSIVSCSLPLATPLSTVAIPGISGSKLIPPALVSTTVRMAAPSRWKIGSASHSPSSAAGSGCWVPRQPRPAHSARRRLSKVRERRRCRRRPYRVSPAISKA